MLTIRATNVNDAYPFGVNLLLTQGTRRPSRYGEVLKMNEPVTTLYSNPRERVLFDPARDANPFFHLMESLWILGGRNDVGFLTGFNKKMAEFSDDGHVFHAPYGFRLRHWNAAHDMAMAWGGDQLAAAISMLKENPENRRVVCSIWSPELDLAQDSKDIPCNDTIKFEANDDGALDMIVFCRSNDAIWGTYGANAVQFSMIQEYVASMAGLPVGRYWQISANFHAYTAVLDKMGLSQTARLEEYPREPYAWTSGVRPFPVVTDPERWDMDLHAFLRMVDERPAFDDDHVIEYDNAFFSTTAEPMYWAWRSYKHDAFGQAFDSVDTVSAGDWRLAGRQWLERRQERRTIANTPSLLGAEG